MGFRCSLLGHTFDETDVRRDREVRGDEVVTIVRTVEQCSKCGSERVVSENKEVVSVVDADDVDLDDGSVETVAGADPPGEPGAAVDHGTSRTEGDPAQTDAEVQAAEDGPTDAEPAPETSAGDGDPPEAPDLDDDPDPEEEDVEFITETDGSLGGGDDVDVDPSDIQGEPPSGGIGGMAARSGAFGDETGGGGAADEDGPAAGSEDAEILGGEPPRDRAPGQWPDDPDAAEEPWEPEPLGGRGESDAGDSDDDGTAEERPGAPAAPAPDVEPAAEPTSTPDGRLVCPNCGHGVPAASSFRAGDACPECREGYLEGTE